MAKLPDRQGVFFELDGVLVPHVRLAEQDQITFLPRALTALQRIDREQFSIFIATSRTDIAFGELKERDFTRYCEVLVQKLRDAGVSIQKIYSCPYHPKGKGRFRKDSVFRKPAQGIFKMAQQEFDLNLQRSWMVGHTTTDILAAQRADMGTVLVKTGAGGNDGAYVVEPHFTEADCYDAVLRLNQFEFAMRA